MEFIKTEPEPDGESYLISAYDQNEITGVREDEDPLLVQCPFIKTENEVSCMAITNDIEPLTISRYRILYPQYFVHDVFWIRDFFFPVIWSTLSRIY